jgi:hypothetical protein
LTGNAWFEYDESPTSSGLDEINATALLGIINSGINPVPFQLVTGSNSGLYFPVLVQSGVITLANQPQTLIYWLILEEPQPENNNQTSPSQPAPVFNDPSRGEPYIYDPVFLTIEVANQVIEIGRVFELTYRGFSTFGPIIKDYTDDVIVTGSVNSNALGTYPLTLSLTAEGLTITKQITVQVVDTTPPVISGPTNVRLFVGEAYQSQLTVTDNVDTAVGLNPSHIT